MPATPLLRARIDPGSYRADTTPKERGKSCQQLLHISTEEIDAGVRAAAVEREPLPVPVPGQGFPDSS